MIQKRLLVFLLTIYWTGVYSQADISDSSFRFTSFYAFYGVQMPGGDLADRYGINSEIGGGVLFKTGKNLLLGASYTHLFGGKIKIENDIMTNLRTADGNIIDGGGTLGLISLFERGTGIDINMGKVFPFVGPNPNSGLFFLAGVGYFDHKIRIEVDDNTIPQLAGDYKKGYDRWCGGIKLNQTIGYMNFSNSRIVNFFAGFEFIQAWTSPYRQVYFDTGLPDPKQSRLDLLFGIRIGWIIPVYRKVPQKFYY